ncbi:MAG: chlororespiratory reduction protein 7 [Phormidesmis sp.]
MADSMMYSEDMFVFLTPDASETFLTPPELIDKLKAVLASYDGQLPPELRSLSSSDAQAKYLLETHCEFETAPGESVQWYAVRLEK